VWDAASTIALRPDDNPSTVSRTILATIKSDTATTTAKWNADGSTLAIGERNGKLHLWDCETKRTKSMTGYSPVHALAWSSDGARIAAAGDSHVTLWDVAKRTAVSKLRSRNRGTVQAVAFSPDGAALASAGLTERACVWDTRREAVTSMLNSPRSFAAGAAWRPDGGMLATLSTRGTVRLWLMPQGQLISEERPVTAATDEVMVGPAGLGFSPDGRLLVAPRGKGVWVMDVGRKRELAVLRGHCGRVRAAAFSPDGTMVASASEDGAVLMWGLKDSKEV
jgi:WD40 repeat protein